MRSKNVKIPMFLLVIGIVLTVDSIQDSETNKNNNNYVKRVAKASLYTSKECESEIMRYCPRANRIELSDMAVLQCIYNQVADLSRVSADCQNVNFIRFKFCLLF